MFYYVFAKYKKTIDLELDDKIRAAAGRRIDEGSGYDFKTRTRDITWRYQRRRDAEKLCAKIKNRVPRISVTLHQVDGEGWKKLREF